MAAREAMFIRDVLVDFGIPSNAPTDMLLDNKSAVDMAFDPVSFKKTKHILRDAFFLRDLVARLAFCPRHVPASDQLADIFTKAVARALFVSLVRRILGD